MTRIYSKLPCPAAVLLCDAQLPSSGLQHSERLEIDAMATSNKFDLSSASPDRPLYASGQRGSYMAASFGRSSSFRENVENPILSSLPSMSRSTSSVTQGDVMSFLQCLRFDPKSIIVDHKLNRQGEFKRFAGLAIGLQPDESPSSSTKSKVPSLSPEEVKRFRIGLRESTIKAR